VGRTDNHKTESDVLVAHVRCHFGRQNQLTRDPSLLSGFHLIAPGTSIFIQNRLLWPSMVAQVVLMMINFQITT